MDRGKKTINFDEEDDKPIQIKGYGEVIDETVALCLLGKLWTEKPYNTYGLIETMNKVWCPMKGMVCRELGNNLISFQFHSKRDMDKVLDIEL